MLPHTANGDSRLSFWLRVREFAVPPSMIETATARRHAGDWAGACAAAGVDLDLDLRSVARAHGRELAARVRADLRRLAPDLLRWHLPRIAPDGLLRPGLTLTLARYGDDDATGPPHLVVRTPPAWADGGQRISLALWDGTRRDADARRHPHPRPNRWFRLDLHRHLWDAGRSGELRARSGADRPETPDPLEVLEGVPEGRHCAIGRWAAEAAILLHAEERTTGPVTVRLGSRHRLTLTPDPVEDTLRIAAAPTDGSARMLPVLPDAATWVLPDLELLRTGSIDADHLHPLVAAALVPDRPCPRPQPHPSARVLDRAGDPHLIECRGAQHRIGLVDGVLAPLDHDPAEIRREELLVALTGTPLPCLQAIDEAHRHPDCLTGVRERLIHGDTAGALAVVEGLLGPDAVLRGGALRDELHAAAERRLVYGLFRAGLTGPGPRSGRFYPGLQDPWKVRPRRTTSR
ncbi:hypothetical protein OG496_17430 [Streptomyces sp. NBC_00988]|uniref:hypothetical protein n=1 Tax=Streptomyces sp. NBC_00988 TaxID=2903704 RepID=UPI0038636D38|nr:hypothetical protein OG496_17430 [Streptomyces sp. NBC_00988]